MPRRSPESRKQSSTSTRTRKPRSRRRSGTDPGQKTSMVNRRVVVTGIGLVSSLGIGTEANWEALCAARSGIGTITKFDASEFATRIAGEVKNFDPLQFVEKKDVKKMDVFIQYAIAASQFAMDDSKLAVTPERSRRIGVFIASGIGGGTTHRAPNQSAPPGGARP